MNKNLVWLLAIPLMAACDVDFDGLGGCSNDREFSDAISAAGMTTLRLVADEGNLQVVGRPGLTQVRVHATACSSSSRTVDDIDFQIFRNGSTVEVETFVPNSDNAHVDLIIEVPEDMAVALFHDDGDIDVRDVDFVFIDDLSGHIDIRNILFDVEIVDESGDIDIYNVGGDIDIEDGSGDIYVEDVDGNFFVRFDTSGSIRHRNVRGLIDLP
jgi:hypothetical protein